MSVFTAALFTIAKIWKHPKCSSTDEWRKTMWYGLSNGILATKENEVLPFETTWMDLEGIMLSEIS